MSYAPVNNPAQASNVSSTCSAPTPPPAQTCCDLVCFERPNYFCGHLLTDADLMKEQQYFREKNKLYNRTLHGWGIVCGLRLTCNSVCPDGILVEEGYAIDDCGNDLVVCESKPVHVIRILKEKGYLVHEPPEDPCRPHRREPECKVRQCYYVPACYDEKREEFTTPSSRVVSPNSLSANQPEYVRECVLTS